MHVRNKEFRPITLVFKYEPKKGKIYSYPKSQGACHLFKVGKMSPCWEGIILALMSLITLTISPNRVSDKQLPDKASILKHAWAWQGKRSLYGFTTRCRSKLLLVMHAQTHKAETEKLKKDWKESPYRQTPQIMPSFLKFSESSWGSEGRGWGVAKNAVKHCNTLPVSSTKN